MADDHDTLRRLVPVLTQIEERLRGIEDKLDTLATKEDLARKPGRSEIWGAIVLFSVIALASWAQRYLP